MQNVLDNEGNNSQQHPLLARSRRVLKTQDRTTQGKLCAQPRRRKIEATDLSPIAKGTRLRGPDATGSWPGQMQPSQHKLRTRPQPPKCPRTAWNHTKKRVSNHNKSSTHTPWTIKYPHPTRGSNDQWVASHPPWQCPTGPRPSLSLTNTHMYAHTGSLQGHMCTLTRCKP